MAMPGGWTMSLVWMPMPGQTWAGTGGRFVAMWLVMMVAMTFGVNCSLCCLGLMVVLLVGGMMNLAVAAAVAVAVAVERLGPRPALLARAIGGVVTATGAVVLARAL